jgi:hypothetical protein
MVSRYDRLRVPFDVYAAPANKAFRRILDHELAVAESICAFVPRCVPLRIVQPDSR